MSRRDSRKSTLFIAGISARTRARDLAYEFERYGRLVRCDIPAPRNHYSSSKPYAFVEYEDPRDAEDAYFEMQNRRIDGYNIIIQWAKNSPQRSWRFEGGNAPPVQYRRGSADDRRSPRDRRDESPKRYSRDRSPERSQFNGNHSPTGKENGRNSRSRSVERMRDDYRNTDTVNEKDISPRRTSRSPSLHRRSHSSSQSPTRRPRRSISPL